MKNLMKAAAIVALVLSTHQNALVAQTELATPAAETIDPEKLASATALMDTIMPADSREAMIDSMVRPLVKNIQAGMLSKPELQKAFADDVEVKNIFERFLQKQNERSISKLHLELPSMITAMSRAYARQFTLEELNDAKLFFATPSGRAYMVKSNSIMADPDVAKWQRDLMASMLANTDGEIKEFVNEVAAHKASKRKTAKSNSARTGKSQ